MISISAIIKTRSLFQKSMFSSQFRFFAKRQQRQKILLDGRERKKKDKRKNYRTITLKIKDSALTSTFILTMC